MILLHLGGLHPFEKALTLVLAFGPFLLLAAVIVVRRRQDARDEAAERARAEEPGGAEDPSVGGQPER